MQGTCGRCFTAAEHLFPVERSAMRICSSCYAAQRLDKQGLLLTHLGTVAMAVGLAILVAIVIVRLTF